MEYDLIKDVWPEWQIVKELGEGSFGKVYEALRSDHSLETRCAIKVISIPRNSSELDSIRMEGLSLEDSITYLHGVVDDCVNEIQLMESFKGTQNIVSVEDYKVVEKKGTVGWDIYIRMELLTSFNKYATENALPESEVIRLGVDVCKALELCAMRNVIHRDVKPENIFINSFGDYKLGDFGIARKLESLTEGMSQKGTYNYMAPEIERGETYNATVDLYSLGIVLYKLLNKNRMPFLDTEKQILNPSERREALLKRLSGEPLPPPRDASDAMAKVILRACEPDPKNRYQTATEMKQALLNISGSETLFSPDNQTTNKELSRWKSRKTILLMLAIFLLIILGGVAGYVKYRQAHSENTSGGSNVLAKQASIGSNSETKSGSNDSSEVETGEDGTDTKEKDEQLSEEEYEIKEALAYVEKCELEGNYLNALEKVTLVNERYPGNRAILEKLVSVDFDAHYMHAQESLNDIILQLNEAYDLFQGKKWANALALLYKTQETYPTSLILKTEIQEFEEFLPIDLFTLETLKTSTDLHYYKMGGSDNGSDFYWNYYFQFKDANVMKGYTVIQLNGNYDKLEGVITFTPVYLQADQTMHDPPFDYKVTLYNDAMEAVGSVQARKEDRNTSVSFNVSGINTLTIWFERIFDPSETDFRDLGYYHLNHWYVYKSPPYYLEWND